MQKMIVLNNCTEALVFIIMVRFKNTMSAV